MMVAMICSLRRFMQVMRYAYGGTPMWCTHPAPETDTRSISLCPSCRSPRVFELQIMPALINFVEEALSLSTGREEGVTVVGGKESGKGDGGAEPRSLLDLNSGFDFGVVSIWSCPNSCEACSQEVAIVQAPSDMA
jgi:hypothetical protein